MNEFTPIPAFVGGALIGLAASFLLLSHGKVAGISGLYGGMLRRGTSDRAFRVWFLAGLVVTGGLVRVMFPAAFTTTWNATLPSSSLRG